VTWLTAFSYYSHYRGFGHLTPQDFQYFQAMEETRPIRVAMIATLVLLLPFALALGWACIRFAEYGNNDRFLVSLAMKAGFGEKLEQAGYGDWLKEMGYDPSQNLRRSVWRYVYAFLFFAALITLKALVKN
jgi:hypothetical protein